MTVSGTGGGALFSFIYIYIYIYIYIHTWDNLLRDTSHYDGQLFAGSMLTCYCLCHSPLAILCPHDNGSHVWTIVHDFSPFNRCELADKYPLGIKCIMSI